MFGKHVKKELSAHAHGELSRGEAERVARHLQACAACREELEQVTFGIRLAEHLPPAVAPASVWEGVETALRARDAKAKASAKHAPPRRLFFFPVGRRFGFAALALLLVLGATTFFVYRRAARSGWEVTSLGGTLLIDSARITKAGRLAVGAWLETDAGSRARIQVANIGQVEIEPETRVRLVETGLTEHRLELQRGRISARIWAPPRLFFVDTPSAVAEDLGCAYTLEVDDEGRSLLHVTSGWVALVLNERESMVPAGAACATQKGTGPGTPFFEDATEPFVAALARLDFQGGGSEALSTVLAEARPRDTLTLWHLIPRVSGEDRVRVYEKLAAFAPPPEGVARDAVLAGDARALAGWKEELQQAWVDEPLSRVRHKWRELWKFKE